MRKTRSHRLSKARTTSKVQRRRRKTTREAKARKERSKLLMNTEMVDTSTNMENGWKAAIPIMRTMKKRRKRKT